MRRHPNDSIKSALPDRETNTRKNPRKGIMKERLSRLGPAAIIFMFPFPP